MSLYAYGNTAKCNPNINEDAVYVGDINGYIVMMVADGNGTKKSMINPGSLAISIAVDYLKNFITDKTSIDDINAQIKYMMYTISRSFLSINAIDEKYANIYASLSVLVINNITLKGVAASIGNCEMRLIRNGQLKRLNHLHCEAFELFSKGEINEDEFFTHPKRAILTSALGVFDMPKFDILQEQFNSNDIILLSSDGLHRIIHPTEVLQLLSKYDDMNEGVDNVLIKASDDGCEDNCTLICCYINDDNGMSIEDKSQAISSPIFNPKSSLSSQNNSQSLNANAKNDGEKQGENNENVGNKWGEKQGGNSSNNNSNYYDPFQNMKKKKKKR